MMNPGKGLSAEKYGLWQNTYTVKEWLWHFQGWKWMSSQAGSVWSPVESAKTVRSTTRTTRTKRAQSWELLEISMCEASDHLFFTLPPILFPTSAAQWNNHTEHCFQNPLPSRILLTFTSVLSQPPSAQTLARNHLMILSYFHASQIVFCLIMLCQRLEPTTMLLAANKRKFKSV